jgi:hypothetical protein
MKISRFLLFSLLLTGLPESGRAAVVSNLFDGAGFEALIGNEPNAGTSPWFTTDEGNDFSFISATNQAYGGNISLKYNYYYDAGAVVQNLDATVDAGADYEVSMWMLTAEPSPNAAHSNAPTINIGLYTSTNSGLSYSYATTLYGGALNSDTNLWEQFSTVISGASLAPYAGQDIQIRFNKPNQFTTHKIYLDDVVFGEQFQEPPPPNLLADPGFEDTVSGNEPNADTDPWFTIDENQAGSFVTDTNIAYSGGQSAKFTFFFDQGSIVQNLTNRIDTALDYTASVWMRSGDDSANTNHVNDPSLAIDLYTSPTLGSGYLYADTFTAGCLNSASNLWERFEGTLPGALLAGRDGHYIQLRITKENEDARNRIWIDDAALSAPIHVPATYYVDATGGNDANSGQSTAEAWQTLDRISEEVYGPGDRILFKRDETFTGRFVFKGAGTETDPLIIGAYGTGEKPVLEGGYGDAEVIYAENSQGFEIRDLTITHDRPFGGLDNRYGVLLNPRYNAGELKHIQFVNVDFVDIQGAGTNHESRGIQADTDSNTAAPILSRFNGFLIEGCRFENIDGRGAQIRDSCGDIADYLISDGPYYPSTNVIFQYNTGINCYRNLYQLRGASDGLIQYNTMDGTQEGSAFWPFACEGTVVQFNIFRNILKDGADASACHFDFNCKDTLMQYNIGINVQGSLIQVLNNSNGSNFQINAVARYNLGIDCGWRNNDNSAGIIITGDATGSKIYNNTLITTDLHPTYKAISFANWGGQWPTNSYIANNLFFAAGSPATYANEDKMTIRNNVVTHNLYTGNVAVCSADLSPVTGSPEFSDPAGTNAADFTVTYGSAAIAAGTFIADNGGWDYFGNPLTNSPPTIGFHEYQSDGTIDSDGDRMPDLWESRYGLQPDVNDASLDGDEDHRSNLDEYAANTHPGDGASYFDPVVDLGVPQLSWTVRPERFYQVYSSSNLLSGSWTPVQSNAVPPVAIDVIGAEGFWKVVVGTGSP